MSKVYVMPSRRQKQDLAEIPGGLEGVAMLAVAFFWGMYWWFGVPSYPYHSNISSIVNPVYTGLADIVGAAWTVACFRLIVQTLKLRSEAMVIFGVLSIFAILLCGTELVFPTAAILLATSKILKICRN